MQTHETFIQAIAAAVIEHLPVSADRGKLLSIKLVYGSGPNGTRGVTFFQRWKRDPETVVPFVEVSAFGQESVCQLAGTTVHELAHVLAGWQAGHGPAWKAACETLGLRRARAAGHVYHWANFAPWLREAIARLEKPAEGMPIAPLAGMGGMPITFKACPVGIGTRGGKSRGKGSGSRLRLWSCSCGCKARVASDDFQAIHVPCGTTFKRA